MSTSAEVADLEDVFAKASMPIQTTQSDSQENTVIAKSSTNILSEFTNAVLASPEVSKKADEINAPVLSDSIGLSEEIQEVLIESAIVTEGAGLVPVIETTKTITETTSTAVTGSVELAEEIMEVFANTKNVLDTENPVSNDPCTLQEELERLEQLAVERVREIEGELVNSTKQITECNLSLDVPKEPISTDVTRNEQKAFECEMVAPDTTDTSAKEVGESLCDDVVATVDLTSPSELISGIPEISCADETVEKKEIKSSSHEVLSESRVDSAIAKKIEPDNSELIDINKSGVKKTLKLECKNNDIISEQKDKIENTIMVVEEKKNDVVSKLEGKANYSVAEVGAGVDIQGSMVHKLSDTEDKTNLSEMNNAKEYVKGSKPHVESEIAGSEEEEGKLVGKKGDRSNSPVTLVTQEIILEKQYLSDKSGESKDDAMKFAKPYKNILETGEEPVVTQMVGDGRKIKDIQNYETEDDDLEVLEAFIVKTATNPELAVCTVQPSKDDGVSKYSLESALLDDLTKTDNSNSTNDIENRSDKVNEDSSFVKSVEDEAPHEKSSKKITSLMDTSDTNSKACENTVGNNLQKQMSSESSERKLSETKSTTQKSGNGIAFIDNSEKGSNKKAEKKVVFVEVKRRVGRPLISGKKTSCGETSALLRKENNIDLAVSKKSHSGKVAVEDKPAKQDQSSIKKSVKNSKKIKVSEESAPSTSGIVPCQQVAEHSGMSKIQKKYVEQITDSVASTSKTTLKNNENKGEVTSKTVLKIETSSKEKKKSKDFESKYDEKSTPHAGLESISDKRSTENDSVLKPCKKDERRLKENVEAPFNRNIKGGSSNSDAIYSCPTRSAKKTVTVKSPQPMNLIEHMKEKNKENVEKLSKMSVGEGDIRRCTERTVPKENSLKNEKGQPQKCRRSFSEDAIDAKKKNAGSSQASVTAKHDLGEQDVEGLPNSLASTSTHNKAEEKSDRNSPSPNVPSIKLSQKAGGEENLHDSGTLVKRKRAEKEIEGDIQLSSFSVKRKRLEAGGKEVSSELQISPSMLKRREAEMDIEQSSHTVQVSPTTLTHKRVEREFEQNVPDVGIEYTHVTHGDSDSTGEAVHRVPNVYSDSLFVEFEELTFDMLRSKAKQLVLPTPLWGAQVSSEKDLVAFSRLRADLSDDKPMIDKALVFQGSLKPIALINNEPVDLPIPCVRTFEDVVMLIRNFHSVSFCEGTGVKQRPQSKSCFRYLDIANPGGRCSQCLEERRRVLFGCARKLRERINVMKAAKSHQ